MDEHETMWEHEHYRYLESIEDSIYEYNDYPDEEYDPTKEY